jgi:hypothetical protein
MFQSSAIKREKATRALIDYDGVAGDILANWKLTRSKWVPVVPFVMRIASDLYHDAGETSTQTATKRSRRRSPLLCRV